MFSERTHHFALVKCTAPYTCKMLPLETKQSGGKLLPHSDLREGGGVFLGEISSSRSHYKCLKERRGYSHLKEEALDRTMWRAGFGIGFGPVVRQTTK
jgi:hypothetical protein